MRVAVVGAGLTGLAISNLLARQGNEVTVIEAMSEVGGVARALSFFGHQFSPGPQYIWDWHAEGAAQRIARRLHLQFDVKQLPDTFERLAIGASDFQEVHANIPTEVHALPKKERASVLKMAEILDALGRAGTAISEGAHFRSGGRAMMGAVARAPLSFSDKTWVARLRNQSVAGLARSLGVSDRGLRLLTHSQSIFAESLEELSVVLFASARHHLRTAPQVPQVGFSSAIDAFENATLEAGTRLITSTKVVNANLENGGTRLMLQENSCSSPTVLEVNEVVWACSPGALVNLATSGLHAPSLRTRLQQKTDQMAATLKARFEPSHPIRCVCLGMRFPESSMEHLRLKNFSWFEQEGDATFERTKEPADASSPTSSDEEAISAINFTSPTLNSGAAGCEQVVCAFVPSHFSAEQTRTLTLRLLEKANAPGQCCEMLDLGPHQWDREFGAHQGALYGRRMTPSSLRRSLCELMPNGWHLAHSGAGIPGFLGCLQLAEATLEDVLRSHDEGKRA